MARSLCDISAISSLKCRSSSISDMIQLIPVHLLLMVSEMAGKGLRVVQCVQYLFIIIYPVDGELKIASYSIKEGYCLS